MRKFVEEKTQFVAPVLSWIVTATDSDSSTENRCKAIEDLSSARVELNREEIEELLKTEDSAVQVYAVALIQDSPDREDLLKFAQSAANESPDTPFADEVRLLVDLLGSGE